MGIVTTCIIMEKELLRSNSRKFRIRTYKQRKKRKEIETLRGSGHVNCIVSGVFEYFI